MAIDRLGIGIHLGSLFLVFLRSKLRELCKGYSKDCRKQQTKVPVIPSAQSFCDKPIRARSLRGKNFRIQITIVFSFASEWPRIQHVQHFEPITKHSNDSQKVRQERSTNLSLLNTFV